MSTARSFDPRHLDVPAFAAAAARLQGHWPLSGMPRLLQDALPESADAQLDWSVQGERRPVAGEDGRLLLHLQAQAVVRLSCQRCLQPVSVPLQVNTSLRFVRGEALAEKLDEDSDEDVLALSGALDLHGLVEDELILALPLVPRHERCPQPLPMSAGELQAGGSEEEEKKSGGAFAALAGLLKDARGKSG
ncbi:MAG TPA: YceD family protein [Rubrivivax sp.]|nr:YceD family protein [Rubrivivax sp.]